MNRSNREQHPPSTPYRTIARVLQQIQKFNFLFCGQKRGLKGIPRQLTRCSSVNPKRLLHQLILLNQRLPKHRRVIRIKRQHQSLIKYRRTECSAKSAQHPVRKSLVTQISIGTCRSRQFLDQLRILATVKSVPNPFRLQVL